VFFQLLKLLLSWYPITNASFGVGCVNNFTNIYSVYIYFGSNVPSGPSEMTLIQNVTFGGLSSISYPTYNVGTYWWTVVTYNGALMSWPEIINFSVCTISAVSLVSPINGTTLDLDNTISSINFQWINSTTSCTSGLPVYSLVINSTTYSTSSTSQSISNLEQGSYIWVCL